MSEIKIDLLLGEVRKLGHQMEYMSLKFELLERELQRSSQPSIIVKYVPQIIICIVFKVRDSSFLKHKYNVIL